MAPSGLQIVCTCIKIIEKMHLKIFAISVLVIFKQEFSLNNAMQNLFINTYRIKNWPIVLWQFVRNVNKVILVFCLFEYRSNFVK